MDRRSQQNARALPDRLGGELWRNDIGGVAGGEVDWRRFTNQGTDVPRFLAVPYR